jgi:hypothetical protein
MKDSSEYPAAHSMDTMWFAVDPEGNVAVFDSGEAGAVPVDGYVGEDHFELLEAMTDTGHTSGVIWEVGRLLGQHTSAALNAESSFLMVLRSTDALRAELDGGSARRIGTSGVSEGVGVIVEKLSNALYSTLHESGACLGCTWHFENEDSPDPATLGLFRYEHSCENWISGPYELTARPERPLLAEALPKAVAAHCVRVDRPFRDLTNINPPEHWTCESWEPAWLDSDGKTVHPFPGREKEFDEVAADLGSQYVISRGATPATPPTRNGHDATKGRRPWWKFW